MPCDRRRPRCQVRHVPATLGSVEITPGEIAESLGVEPKTLRAWLRAERTAGHPLLDAHEHGAHYHFTRAEAAQLIAEYRASGGRGRAPGQPYTGAAKAPASPAPPKRHSPAKPETRPRVVGLPAPSENPFDGLEFSEAPGHRVTEPWMGEDVITLADLLRGGLLAVVVGINPSPVSVAAGHYYQGRVGQRFLARLVTSGVLDLSGEGFEDDRAFAQGIGFTDAVKRPTARAGGLRAGELEHGRELLEARLAAIGAPRVIFTFKRAATTLLGEFAGHGVLTDRSLGGTGVFVMPGPMERTDRVDRALRDLRAWWAE